MAGHLDLGHNSCGEAAVVKPQPVSCASKAFAGIRLVVKSLGVLVIATFFCIALLQRPSSFIDSEHARAVVMSLLFVAGLVIVVVEDHVNVNKAATMLLVSAAMWTFLAVGYHPNSSHKGHMLLDHELEKGLKDVGSIILFLLPAMGLVESIDHFDGFAVVTHIIRKIISGRKARLMPALGCITFFLSAIIDNLTATIVALKILRHVEPRDRHLRHLIGGMVVIAANAGGAWSPMGDVTTTMLWLQNKISVGRTLAWLFLPSLMTAGVPMLGLWVQACRQTEASAEGDEEAGREGAAADGAHGGENITRAKVLVLSLGLVCIFMVPVLKIATGLPPYMGMLLALGVLWFVTDTRAFWKLAKISDEPSSPRAAGDGTPHTPKEEHFGEEGVTEALHKMDLTGLLFFAGVLLAVGALNTAGVLEDYANLLIRLCGQSSVLIGSLLGVSSAVVDNVPLVQAAINMFDKPVDDPLWQLVALAAGTGGSILSVGSIAGVTLMTMEGVGYLWYCRRVSLWAALGFACGIGTYQLERLLFA